MSSGKNYDDTEKIQGAKNSLRGTIAISIRGIPLGIETVRLSKEGTLS